MYVCLMGCVEPCSDALEHVVLMFTGCSGAMLKFDHYLHKIASFGDNSSEPLILLKQLIETLVLSFQCTIVHTQCVQRMTSMTLCSTRGKAK
jgi:hypothetical protein